MLAIYFVYRWCIGTDPYPAKEEGLTFQAFESVNEPEWSADDGYEAVWDRTGVTFIGETILVAILNNEHKFSCFI